MAGCGIQHDDTRSRGDGNGRTDGQELARRHPMRIALAFVAAASAAAIAATGCASDPADNNTGMGSDEGSGSGSGSDEGSGSGSGSGEPTPVCGNGIPELGEACDDVTQANGDGCENDCTVTPPSPTATGAYSVRTEISLTVEALLPEPAADLVGTLRDFSINPAATLFDLAEAAGVPAVAEIRDALPASVEDKLYGWINGEIAKLEVNGTPVTSVAGWIVGWAEAVLTTFALDSQLTESAGTCTHTLTNLDFYPAGINIVFPVNDLTSNVITQTAACSSTAGTFTMGDHTFGLAYGEYMWRAFEAAIAAESGTDIRSTLSAAVNCPALAQVVAAKCYQGYCVGHASQLTAICEAGIDEVVDRAYAKVAALRFDAIHLAAGTATLVDADANFDAEAMTSGVWTAEINAGVGLRTVPATFSATR